MPNWKKVIVSGSDAVLNDITASGGANILGSTTFGNTANNTHIFSGSVEVVNGTLTADGGGLYNVPVPLDWDGTPKTGYLTTFIDKSYQANGATNDINLYNTSSFILSGSESTGQYPILYWDDISDDSLGPYTSNIFGVALTNPCIVFTSSDAGSQLGSSEQTFLNLAAGSTTKIIDLASVDTNNDGKVTGGELLQAIYNTLIEEKSNPTSFYTTINYDFTDVYNINSNGGQKLRFALYASATTLLNTKIVKTNLFNNDWTTVGTGVTQSKDNIDISTFANTVKNIFYENLNTDLDTTINASFTVSGSITASGNISGSGNLYANLSENSSNYNTVVYNTSTGQFFYTGSYGGSGGGATINNDGNNRITTANGDGTLNAEANLSFNGSSLSIAGGILQTYGGSRVLVSDVTNGSYPFFQVGDIQLNRRNTIFEVQDESGSFYFYTENNDPHYLNSESLFISGNISGSNLYIDNRPTTKPSVFTGRVQALSFSGSIITNNITGEWISNNGNNRVVTSNGNGTFTAESGLTFDGNELLLSGDLNVDGNITANQYIVSSSVTYMTQSFSSGSTIFGDTLDDTHLFTGSVDITGSLTVDGITYPTIDGDNGDMLVTDGAGNLSFTRTTVYANVKNVSGVDLVKGYPVHVTGTSGNASEIIVASASNAATMPAHFILNEDINNGAEGQAIAIGFINGVNTVGFGEGNTIYVNTDGGYTNVKPTGSNLIQNLGIVTKVAANGSGYVLGAGRSNDIPNISPGYAWVGNSDSVATAVPTSSFAGVGDNLGNHIATQDLDMAGFSISASFNITASGNISASGYIVGSNFSTKNLNIFPQTLDSSSLEILSIPENVSHHQGVLKETLTLDSDGYGTSNLFKVTSSIESITINPTIIYNPTGGDKTRIKLSLSITPDNAIPTNISIQNFIFSYNFGSISYSSGFTTNNLGVSLISPFLYKHNLSAFNSELSFWDISLSSDSQYLEFKFILDATTAGENNMGTSNLTNTDINFLIPYELYKF